MKEKSPWPEPAQEDEKTIDFDVEKKASIIRKLVKQGKINPQDVFLIGVSENPNDKVSEAARVRIDKDGRVMDPVPGGFFTQRYKELAP